MMCIFGCEILIIEKFVKSPKHIEPNSLTAISNRNKTLLRTTISKSNLMNTAMNVINFV